MAYNANAPADDQTIAAGPADIRTNQEALRTGGIVNAGTVNGLTTGNATGNIPVANGTLCKNLNAEMLGGLLAAAFALVGHTHSVATGSSNGFMSNTDFTKLAGIATGAEVNQNTFSNVLVGSTTIQADSKMDTLEMVAGANIAITADATNDRLTISITGAVPVANGGTGATTAAGALTNLGVTTFARSLLDDADAATARATLGAAPAGYGPGESITPQAGIDLNSIVLTGLYYVNNSCTNKPGGNGGHLWVNYTNGPLVSQLFIEATSGLVYTRYYYYVTGSWSVWKQLATMDLVLPLTGGTLTNSSGAVELAIYGQLNTKRHGLLLGRTGMYGYLDYDTSANSVRLSGYGPLVFGHNTNVAHNSETFTEYLRITADGKIIPSGTITVPNNMYIKALDSSGTSQNLCGINTGNESVLGSPGITRSVLAVQNHTDGARVSDGSSWKKIATTDDISAVGTIIAEGSGTDYYWRKWSSGKIEIFGHATGGTVTSFPIQFPTACQYAFAVLDTGGDSARSVTSIVRTTSTITVHEHETDGGQSRSGDSVMYYAVGD